MYKIFSIDEILCLKAMNAEVIIVLQNNNNINSLTSLYLIRQKIKQYVDIFLIIHHKLQFSTINKGLVENTATNDYLINNLLNNNTLIIFNVELLEDSKLNIYSQVIDSVDPYTLQDILEDDFTKKSIISTTNTKIIIIAIIIIILLLFIIFLYSC